MCTKTIVLLLASLALAQAGELHEAARDCEADHMRQLLATQPLLNEADENGMTPLHIAIDSRQRTCVGLLLEAGADRRTLDGKGRTAFDAADQITDMEDRAAIRLYLFLNADENKIQESTGPKPWSLEYAVTHRQTGATKMLLSLGADPNATGTRGTTPLADAALKGHLDGVRLLLQAGAKLDAVGPTGTQPIHDAALGNSAEVIRELARQGADLNARTQEDGQTPLHLAALMGKMKAVEALIELGADLTAKDSHGGTPLDAAERVGLTDAAALLRRSATGQ